MKRFIGWLGILLTLPSVLYSQDSMFNTNATVSHRTVPPLELQSQGELEFPNELHQMLHFHDADTAGTNPDRSWYIPTILTQLATQALSTVIIGGFSFAVLAPILDFDVGGPNTTIDQRYLGMVILFAGTSLGLSAGTHWGGDFWAMRSDFWPTYLGAALGVAAGVTTGILINNSTDDPLTILLGAASVASIPPILFFHANAHPRIEEANSSAEASRIKSIHAYRPMGMESHVQLQVLSVPLDW